eukprot:CAMPEP_0174841136 /NCGR_PEP_ID=MMETSP1114-20130205/9114_1 /TAXON_ID=312471 /ORGANISM="Neobodo designis, Strain CCAP 1951/1" /LENGTH=61 /DNA_ID=CAMNT_0016075311 /DNA_START=32 /DNA_END=217 /DNA_ORIENTATION=+
MSSPSPDGRGTNGARKTGPSTAAAARRQEGEPEVEIDSHGHEVFKTRGVGGSCVAHDYHFV